LRLVVAARFPCSDAMIGRQASDSEREKEAGWRSKPWCRNLKSRRSIPRLAPTFESSLARRVTPQP